MRGLMAAVIGMGILIVAGVTVLVVVMVQRMSAPPPPIASAVVAAPATPGTIAADILIDEPAGTRIATLAIAGDHLALQLAGGGPDRVVVVDTRSGRIVARTGLAR